MQQIVLHKLREFIDSYRLSLAVILLGILFTMYLLSFIDSEVFYSGDGGLKAVVAKQLARGDFHFDMRLPGEPWVKALWEEGFYPFHAPFVIKLGNKHYSIYTFTFPLVSAPFYALAGYKGLYAIPAVSAWVLWGTMLYVFVRMRLNDYFAAFGLFVFLFATPVTLYAGIFWEHTLALALAFASIVIILFSSSTNNIYIRTAAGWMLGFSIWFRPEFFCLLFALMLWTVIEYGLKREWQKNAWLLLHAGISIGIYIIINLFLFGLPLSPHGTLVTDHLSLSERVSLAFEYGSSMWAQLKPSLPVIWPALLLLPWTVKKRNNPFYMEMRILVYLEVFMLLFVPLMIPSDGGKQIGPRFWLFLMPIVVILLVWGMSQIQSRLHSMGTGVIVLFVFYFVIQGIRFNIGFGAQNIIESHRATNETLAYIMGSNETVVVTPNMYIPMGLEASLDAKPWFNAPDQDRLLLLLSKLKGLNTNRFLYATFNTQPFPEIREFLFQDQKIQVRITEPKSFGTVLVYHVWFE